MSLRRFAYQRCTRNIRSVFRGAVNSEYLKVDPEVSQTHHADEDELPAGTQELCPWDGQRWQDKGCCARLHTPKASKLRFVMLVTDEITY